MSPDIEIWDLDLVDCLEPIIKLKSSSSRNEKSKKKRKVQIPDEDLTDAKDSTNILCHTDAILDLAWNKNMEHILASSSADCSIILWDLESAKGSAILSGHTGKVQCIKWHPFEAEMLVSGDSDGIVKLWDCKALTSNLEWKLDGEVEQVLWNHFDPFQFFAATDKGQIYSMDCRNSSTPLCSINASSSCSAISGLTMSPSVKGCLVSVSIDGFLRVWNCSNQIIQLVTEEKMPVGRIHCCRFCPDNPWLVAIGGEKEEGIELVDLRNLNKVTTTFETEDSSVVQSQVNVSTAASNGSIKKKNSETKRKRKHEN